MSTAYPIYAKHKLGVRVVLRARSFRLLDILVKAQRFALGMPAEPSVARRLAKRRVHGPLHRLGVSEATGTL